MFKIWQNTDKLKCPSCRSTRITKDGFVHGKQRYRCKKCGYYTVIPYGKRGQRR